MKASNSVRVGRILGGRDQSASGWVSWPEYCISWPSSQGFRGVVCHRQCCLLSVLPVRLEPIQWRPMGQQDTTFDIVAVAVMVAPSWVNPEEDRCCTPPATNTAIPYQTQTQVHPYQSKYCKRFNWQLVANLLVIVRRCGAEEMKMPFRLCRSLACIVMHTVLSVSNSPPGR